MLPLDANPHVIDCVTSPTEQLFSKWAQSTINPPPPKEPPQLK